MNYKNYSIISEVKNITLDEFGSLFGGDSSCVSISKNTVLKNSDIVYACCNYIANTISKMPINLYENTENGKEKVSNDLIYLVKNRPNPYMTYTDFISALISNMLIYGNGFAKIITRAGKVVELQLLDSSSTNLEKKAGKWFVRTNIDSKQEVLNYNQVIHIRDLTVDGVQGISRIEAITNKINNRVSADNKLNQYYSSGAGGVKGVITGNFTTSSAKIKYKDGFNKILQSTNDNVAVLEDGVTYTPINATSLADMEFCNNLALAKADICTMFSINPALLGSSKEATNSNMSVMVEDFVKSLQPLIAKIEQEFNYKLLLQGDRKRMYFKLNMTSVLRGNDLERADYYGKMIQNGLLSINDCMDLEDRNHVQGGDERYRSLNYVPLSIANEYQLSKAGANASLVKE